MHIVQVTQSYPPSQGGVEKHVEAISTRLVTRGHEVTIVSADKGVGDPLETRDGVTVRRHKSFSPSGAYHLAPQVASTIRECDPDVVHAHNYHALLLPFAALAVDDATFVITPHYHGGSESGFRSQLLHLYHPIGRRILHHADTVVAVSEWEQKQLQNDFAVEAQVIPNGIEVERFSAANPFEHERPYLLCVGRLEQYKGVQHAIRAIAELPEYDLLIAGSGPYQKHLESIAKQLNVEDRIQFLGYVADEDLASLYAGAEVFVTLSSFESFGLTVGEALASGTPCVILRQGALVDWETYDGVVGVDSPNTGSVVQAIDSVIASDVPIERIPVWEDHVNTLVQVYG
ncbi:glycosyl transferase [Halorubrum sp. E3]|nr:glycosyl transferase [Halorubrum sp. E3]